MITQIRRQVTSDDITEVDLDGCTDEKGYLYVGPARKQPNGLWRCLAIVDSALCIVEIRIRWRETQ